MTATRISYDRLSAMARSEIQNYGVTIASYVRHFDPGGQWRGDRCGCSDDRCIGYHHDATEDCGCLSTLIQREVLGLKSVGYHQPVGGPSATSAMRNGTCWGVLTYSPDGDCRYCGWAP